MGMGMEVRVGGRRRAINRDKAGETPSPPRGAPKKKRSLGVLVVAGG